MGTLSRVLEGKGGARPASARAVPATPSSRAASDSLARDRAFCEELLPRVSRTFALSIATLPESLRETIRVAYLLCRVVDTIEDDARLAPDVRAQLFTEFDDLMRDDGLPVEAFEAIARAHALGGAESHDHALVVGAGAPFRVFRYLPVEHRAAVRPHVLEMSRGMREFSRRAEIAGVLRLADMNDLERYCYFVAGTVGKLLTSLFELAVPSISPHALAEARARAVSFGVALQLVNIVKDVAQDFTRGDCFLPVADAEARGLALDALLEPENRGAALAVVSDVCARARVHLRRAREYTLLWPADEGRDVRLFCAVPLALALATLHEVENGPDAVRPGVTPKVRREVVWRAFADAQRAIGDDTQLSWMLGYYASGMFGDDELTSAGGGASVVGVPPRPSSRGLASCELDAGG